MIEITEYEIILNGVVVAKLEWLPTATYSEHDQAVQEIGNAANLEITDEDPWR